MSDSAEGENANETRTAMISTGTSRNIQGGGGNGGNSSGSTVRDSANRTRTVIEVTLKNLTVINATEHLKLRDKELINEQPPLT
ncbi:hypothetical protein V6N13_087731 [Hibiscus sabdariffa]|uniref:Uncharacterized protein n=1 Tax=Hibiscus sabdariffa TaxID=183260 RepID=A0ABR2FXF9_9ROSI